MVKFSTNFLFVSAISLFLSTNSTFSVEKDAGLEYFNIMNKKFNSSQNVKCIGTIPFKKMANSTMGVNFKPIDSLANSLSFGNDKQMPISKDPLSPNCAIVMRGSHEVTEPDFGRNNSKNNLFLKTSTDNGLTWSAKELIYTNEDLNYGQARYPSCYVLNFGTAENPEIEYLYTFSLVIESTGLWPGFATGLKGAAGNYSVPQSTFEQNGKTYKWGRGYIDETTGQPSWSIADSRIVGWKDENTATNVYCTGPVSVYPNGDVTDNSASAYRLINNDLADLKEEIPATWGSSAFSEVTEVGSRTNVNVNLKRVPDGTMYQAFFGNYSDKSLTDGKNTFSVSKSTDNGATWSDLEVFPWEYIKSYVLSLGRTIALDSIALPYYSNDFFVLPNGDYSYTTILLEFDATKPRMERLNQIVELYKENGEFGVRLVGDNVSHYWVPFTGSDGQQAGNAKSYELQTVLTADGKTIVSKWVELVGEVWPTDDSFQFETSDIFVSKREVGANTWSAKMNITNDAMLDRLVWLPDVLPNDLTKLPIFSVQSKGTDDIANQRLYLSSQLLMAGTFDVTSTGTSVETQPENTNRVGVYPNPTNSDAVVSYNLNNNANVEIVVIDYIGNEVIRKRADNQLVGLNYYNLNFENLSNGSYLVNIYVNGKLEGTQSISYIK